MGKIVALQLINKILGYSSHSQLVLRCNPRLNNMLEALRNKRLVFVGDSLNRNMWESLVCTLRNSVEDKSKVFEASGRREFRTEGFYSFIFKDYNCSVKFFRSPFLVQEWEMPDTNGTKKETLRLDLVERSSSKYKDADIIVFNAGHWWTHDKTSKGIGFKYILFRCNILSSGLIVLGTSIQSGSSLQAE